MSRSRPGQGREQRRRGRGQSPVIRSLRFLQPGLLLVLLLLLGGGPGPMGPLLQAAAAARRRGPRAAFLASMRRSASSMWSLPSLSSSSLRQRVGPWCLLPSPRQQPPRPWRQRGYGSAPFASPTSTSLATPSPLAPGGTGTALGAGSVGKGDARAAPHPAEWLLSGVQAVKGVRLAGRRVVVAVAEFPQNAASFVRPHTP